uniref:Cullin-associated and neddylation-dissociated 1 n=1 Tax=Romanomermis culicivorax TaxID=13658 RepID=A0A915KC78_ROMCU
MHVVMIILQKEIPVCLSVLLDRLKNEVTRLTAVRAMTTICQSSLKISLQPIFAQMVSELSEFLRKNQRSLRLSTIQLLDCSTNRYENLLSQDLIQRIIIELPALINETDLQIAQMAVELLSDLLRVNPSYVANSLQPCMTSVIRLIQSPLLQGSSLNTICKFLTALITANLEWPKFAHLKDILTKTAYDIAQSSTGVALSVIASSSSHHLPTTTAVHGSINHRQAYQNSAKCLAALVATCPEEAEETLNDLINNLRENSKCNDFVQLFSLLALGEIGRECPRVIENRQIELSIMRGFQAHNEETKSAASQALGSLAVGNLGKYLPFVLSEIQSQPKRQYLLLHSLKEIISSESASAEVDSILSIFKPHIDQIWN